MNGDKPLKTNVTIEDFPETHLAYIRHTGPYAGQSALFGQLFGKLMQWAGPRGLFQPPATKFITVYHDDPAITEESKQRISCSMTVAADTAVEGDVGKMMIPAGKYAVGHFEIAADQYGDAWTSLYKGWLPESGFQPDDRPCFELYLNDPNTHPENKHIVDIYVPVKPL